MLAVKLASTSAAGLCVPGADRQGNKEHLTVCRLQFTGPLLLSLRTHATLTARTTYTRVVTKFVVDAVSASAFTPAYKSIGLPNLTAHQLL